MRIHVHFDIDTVRVNPVDSRTLSFEERHDRKSDQELSAPPSGCFSTTWPVNFAGLFA
jgi:hypothetical protein